MAEFTLDYGEPAAALAYHNLDCFTQGYILAMFFTNTGTGDDGDLEDATFAELAPDTLARIIGDCERFQTQNAPHFAPMTPHDEEQAGHDFWFTRNGHGVGFWDGDWPDDIGAALTKASKEFPTLNLDRGDDGQIYLS